MLTFKAVNNLKRRQSPLDTLCSVVAVTGLGISGCGLSSILESQQWIRIVFLFGSYLFVFLFELYLFLEAGQKSQSEYIFGLLYQQIFV